MNHGSVKTTAGVNVYLSHGNPIVTNQKFEALELMERADPQSSEPLEKFDSQLRKSFHHMLLEGTYNRFGSGAEMRRKRDGLI